VSVWPNSTPRRRYSHSKSKLTTESTQTLIPKLTKDTILKVQHHHQHPHRQKMHAIEKNDTWKLTYPPESKKAIGVKWVYKTKKNAKEEVQKYKAIEEGNTYQNEVHAWHDIPRLSLKGRFVVLNSINLEGQGRQPPAVTAQPPATSHQLFAATAASRLHT